MIGIKGNLGFASIEIVEAFGRDGASRNMKEFRPHLEILPPAQMRLWRELSGVPNGFVLYGGTALALHLGHRTSVDFGFFARRQIDHASWRRTFHSWQARGYGP
jgi:Nucleotidyl transferase AbiEii toxin, Type IV TA system